MILKNFEMEAGTGAPVSGATVQAYVASDTHPNPGTVVASTATNTSGMWELTGLADGVNYDIKVTSGSRVKWYKGNTKHNAGHIYDDTTPDPNRNLLTNGGFESWIEFGTGVIALPVTDPGVPNTADYWITYLGTGDSGSAQYESTTVATDSAGSIRIAYTRSGGQATHYRRLPSGVWQGLKGKVFSASFQVYQLTASSELRAFVDDGVTTTYGTVTSVFGSWVTITVTATISLSATRVWVGVRTNRADAGARTFYIDDGMGDIGSLPPVYAPEANDMSLVPGLARTVVVEQAPSGDAYTLSGAINALAHRIMSIIGAAGADWKDAIPRSLTQLIVDIGTKVAKAGDTMTGTLTVSGAGVGLVVTGSAGLSNSGAAGTTLGGSTTTIQSTTGVFVTDPAGVVISGAGGLRVSSSGGCLIDHSLNAASGHLVAADTGQVTFTGTGGISSSNTGLFHHSGAGGMRVSGSAGLFVDNGTTVNGVLNGGTVREAGVDLLRVTEQAADSALLGGIAPSGYSLQPVSGSYTGDDAAIHDISTGFTPNCVLITSKNLAGMVMIMDGIGGSNIYTSTAGRVVLTASGIIAGGFRVNNGTDVINTSGQTYSYIAFP